MANCKICGKSINTHAWYCDDCIKKIQAGKIIPDEKGKDRYIIHTRADNSNLINENMKTSNCKICGKPTNIHPLYCDDCIKKIQTGKITPNEKGKDSYILNLSANNQNQINEKAKMIKCKICGKPTNSHPWYCDECMKKYPTDKARFEKAKEKELENMPEEQRKRLELQEQRKKEQEKLVEEQRKKAQEEQRRRHELQEQREKEMQEKYFGLGESSLSVASGLQLQYVVLQVTLKEKFLGTGSGNLTELEKVINEQAAKGYRLHTITTSSSNSTGFMGGDRIQATMVFEKI